MCVCVCVSTSTLKLWDYSKAKVTTPPLLYHFNTYFAVFKDLQRTQERKVLHICQLLGDRGKGGCGL